MFTAQDLSSRVIRYNVSGNSVTFTDLTISGFPTSAGIDQSSLGAGNAIAFGSTTTGIYLPSRFPLSYSVSGNTITFSSLTATGTTYLDEPAFVGDENSGLLYSRSSSVGNIPDFRTYTISSGAITYTGLREAALSHNKRGAKMVGDATSGILFGGTEFPSPVNYDNNFYRYEVSGNTVTLTALTTMGATVRGRDAHEMWGTKDAFIIFGGFTQAQGRVVWLEDLLLCRVDGNTVNVTSLNIVGLTFTGRIEDFTAWGTQTRGYFYGGLKNTQNTVYPTNFYRYAIY